jgi:hypothetical protein
MRFLFLLTLLSATQCFANSIKEFESTINYINQEFESNHYISLIEQFDFLPTRTFVDQIYQKSDQAVMIKWGVRPINKDLMGKLQNLGFGLTFNDYTSAGIPFSLFFLKIPTEEVEPLLNIVLKALKSKTSFLYHLFGAQAYANSCKATRPESLLSFGEELNLASFKKLVWSCSAAADKGFENKVSEYLDFLDPKNWQPINISSFWSESLKAYNSLKDLIPKLGPILKDFNNIFKKFNPNFKTDFICSSLGSQFIEYISPGGMVKKLFSLKNKITSLKHLQNILKQISNLYEKYPNSKTLQNATQRVGACAL